MARLIRGSGRRVFNIPTTEGFLLIHANPKRAGLFIEADSGNTGNLALGFDDPAVTVTGDKQGLLLGAGDQYTEPPPDSTTGAVYVRSANGTEDLLVREDFLEE